MLTLVAALAGAPAVTASPAAAQAATAGTGAAGTSCATPAAPDFGFDLTGGGWRFRTGDDPSWSDPALSDGSWDGWSVPDNWGQTDLASYDGFAWYRKTFTLPERPAGVTDASVVASLGRVDDADQTFLNGEEIGRTGAFPPAFDSAWEVPRTYYPRDGLLHWGGTNVIAVRVYDGTGGGGFYQGPVGLYSKSRLRELAGLITTPANAAQLKHACAVLDAQHRAVSRGQLSRYAATLDDGFFHQGDTREQRLAEVRAMLRGNGSVTLRDQQAEVVVDGQGRLVVDTIRSWVAADGTVLSPPTREFLYVDPRRPRELGDHARFFRNGYRSAAMGREVSFSVYLPPSYTQTTARRFPTVFMLHGFNGSNIEWEARDMGKVLDKLFAEKGMRESVVVFPDGASGWWTDSSEGKYRSMVAQELVPLVDRTYRTVPDREHRGLSGVSMGGHGAFTLGLTRPDLFSSIASHMGALSFPPLIGTPEERAASAGQQPIKLVNSMTSAQLKEHTYYFDGGDQDEYRFGQAARDMAKALSAKGVSYDTQNGDGHHDDVYWMPKLNRSFALHSAQFDAHPYRQPTEPRKQHTDGYVWP
ncbi:alpha/beta hydrolase-fold protein [Streptomyces sp. NPDC003522]